MIITLAVTLAAFVVLYITVGVTGNNLKRTRYDCVSKPSLGGFVLAHTFFVITLLLIVADMALYWLLEWLVSSVIESLWIIYGLLLLMAILVLIKLFDSYFNYVAVIGDEVFVRRFFTTKRIQINDIWRYRLLFF